MAERYKVYENHKRKIAPEYAQHCSYLLWDDVEKRIVYSWFQQNLTEKVAEILNEETAPLSATIQQQQTEIAGLREAIKSAVKLLDDKYFIPDIEEAERVLEAELAQDAKEGE